MHDPVARIAALAALSGVRADPPDERDHLWVDRPGMVLPPDIGHSHLWVLLEDQLHTGTCVTETLTAICAAIRAAHHVLPVPGIFGADSPNTLSCAIGDRIPLSRLQLYRHAADLLPETAGKDAGTNARSALKIGYRVGIAPESVWPFVEAKVLAPIPPEVDAAGADSRIDSYVRLKNMGEYVSWPVVLRRIKEALATGHMPIVGWALTNDYFYLGKDAPHSSYLGTAKGGSVLAGYHEQAIAGYYSVGVAEYLVLANSWSTSWGAPYGPWPGGFAHVPAFTVINDSLDIWAVTGFEGIDVEQSFRNRQAIARLYVALFGRAADVEGMRFWYDALQRRTPLGDVAAAMYVTAPARAYYPLGFSDAGTVRAFYRNCLGRDPDAEGLAYWTDRLGKNGIGHTIADIVTIVGNYMGTDPAGIASAEYFNARARKSQVWAESGGDVAGATAALA